MKVITTGMLLSGVAVVALGVSAMPAWAAPEPAASPPVLKDVSADTGVQEIIVTAQRKEQRLQDVPISVNVITGTELANRGAALSTDLPNLVPGLTFEKVGGGAGTPYLRGVGSNAANPNDEPSVATYIDGVYIASPYSNTLDMAGLERVEVLKGPQGTLFGRNATGGVIQLITRDPSFKTEVDASAGYANYNTPSGSLYATTKLTDTLAINVSAQGSDQQTGWGHNAILNDQSYKQKEASVRSKLLFEPTNAVRIVLAGDYDVVQGNMAEFRLPAGAIGADGQPSPSNGYDTRTIITTIPGLRSPGNLNRQFGFSLHSSFDLGFASFVNIASYRKSTGYYNAEADGTPLSLVAANLPLYQANFSEEAQLISNKGSRIDWTAGLYYYSNRAGYKNLEFAVPGVPANILSTTLQHTDSISGYGQATLEVINNLRITGGVRYTDENQSLNAKVGLKNILPEFPVDASGVGYKKATYRAAIDYALDHDTHAYFSFNHGVKGGGYDVLSVFNALSGAPVNSFRPEVLDAYEVGFKSVLFDRKLRFNIAGFIYDYTNIQVQVIPAGANSAAVVQTTNAASAKIKGIDADFELRPVKGLSFSGGAAYLDGKYGSFTNTVAYGTFSPYAYAPDNASGQPTIRTPKFTGNLTVAYRYEMPAARLTPSVTVSHNSGFNFGVGGDANSPVPLPALRQNQYTLLNASLSYDFADGRYGVRAWGSNLTNTYYLAQGVPSALGALTSPAAPRTYGITFNAKLGG